MALKPPTSLRQRGFAYENCGSYCIELYNFKRSFIVATSMKEAITVTIDADIHTWIKHNSRKKSQFVNNILRGAKDKWVSKVRIEEPKNDFYCPHCLTVSSQTPTMRGFRKIGYCMNKKCKNYGIEIPMLENTLEEEQ